MNIFNIGTLMLGIFVIGGCTEQQTALRSDKSEGKTSSVSAVQKMKLATPVTVQGIMVEKCPLAGCWFKLHDKTGTIKIDLKATSKTVVSVPLKTEVTVRGKVMPNGSEKMIQAMSATF